MLWLYRNHFHNAIQKENTDLLYITSNHLCVAVLLQVIENIFFCFECIISNFVRKGVCFVIGILYRLWKYNSPTWWSYCMSDFFRWKNSLFISFWFQHFYWSPFNILLRIKRILRCGWIPQQLFSEFQVFTFMSIYRPQHNVGVKQLQNEPKNVPQSSFRC